MRAGELRERAGRVLPFVLLVAGIVVLAAVAGRQGQSGPPLDPDSTAADGTRALFDTLDRLGADVAPDRALPEAGDDVVLLLSDETDDDARDELLAWVEAGGTLVVTDSFSELTPEVVGPVSSGALADLAPLERGDCPITALDDVSEVAPGDFAVTYEAPPGSVGCFARNDGHWLVATARGEGAVVALGGPDVWINVNLGSDDHAQLAAALLVPAEGTSLVVPRPPRPGEGDATLANLIPERVFGFMLQLVVAFCVFAWWRSRRLGPVVVEPQPARVPGSELVTAVGGLLQQTRALGRAATLLRDDLRRALSERLGLPRDTDPEGVANAVAARTGGDREATRAALAPTEPANEAALVRLAQETERLRRDALAAATSKPTAP